MSQDSQISETRLTLLNIEGSSLKLSRVLPRMWLRWNEFIAPLSSDLLPPLPPMLERALSLNGMMIDVMMSLKLC